MAAVTRLGLYGGARAPYGSFAGKTPAAGGAEKTYLRLLIKSQGSQGGTP